MKRILCSVLAVLTLGATAVFGQFGFGITVFDPSVYAEAVIEVANLVKQYNTENKDGLCVNLTVYNWDVFFDKWLSGVQAASGARPGRALRRTGRIAA